MADYVSLKDMIASLEYGTKLHVSVWFFQPVGIAALSLDPEQIMHASPFCDAAKSRPGGYARCIRCKKWANEKALRTRRPFSGYCINGLYEYCIPVGQDGRTVCVVYAGNLVPDKSVFAAKNHPYPVDFSTVETTASVDDCRRAAEAVASYIRMLLALCPPEETDRSGQLVQNLRQYADTNYRYEISLSQLAEMFHYNEKYIGRIFKNEMGISFRQYVNRRRLDYAKKLLATTDVPILDIALRSGFNNVTYFNRVFKECYGVPPTECRKSTE